MTTTAASMSDLPPPSKRARQDGDLIPYSAVTAIRTSSLPCPTLKLTGHSGSVYALEYDATGETLVSASFDMTCLLWNAATGYENYNVLRGHKNAILDLAWFGENIATASADKTLGWYSAATGERIKRMQGHSGIVNSVDTIKTGSAPLLASASDDSTVKLWDARVRGEVVSLEHACPVTAVAYAETLLYTGGLDNQIHAWDVRTQKRTMSLKGHEDTITSLSLHPSSLQLLSNSMDGTLQTWDIAPFCSSPKRHLKTFTGATHNAQKGLLKCAWSADGSMVTGGSADGMVHIWDEVSTEELYLLPGHSGCVNTVVFHPKENVVCSGSSDKTIYVGELGQ